MDFRYKSLVVALLAAAVPALAQQQAPAPAAQAAPATAPAKAFSQQELDELLAPVALYPDALLAQVLMASTYPLEVGIHLQDTGGHRHGTGWRCGGLGHNPAQQEYGQGGIGMNSKHEIKMWTPFTLLLVLFMLAGGAILAVRLFKGLGAVTNLSDRFPWGLWIGVDVLGGLAMAAGGFLIAGAVHILKMKKYRVIVRPAILNAFFGYALAATAISLDIGVPWRTWHPMVMWQIHSIMWVVAIHVVLYTS